MKRRLLEIEASIERYLSALDQADAPAPATEAQSLRKKIAVLEEEMGRLKKLEVRAPNPAQPLTVVADQGYYRGEGLHVLAYSMKRAMKLVGTKTLIEAIQQDRLP